MTIMPVNRWTRLTSTLDFGRGISVFLLLLSRLFLGALSYTYDAQRCRCGWQRSLDPGLKASVMVSVGNRSTNLADNSRFEGAVHSTAHVRTNQRPQPKPPTACPRILYAWPNSI